MSPQETIAHYRIIAKIGEGGMGAVYRATDTKLNRDVAIKVLPDNVAQDPDRLARFAREAQVLASLNHPNIAAIYGVEDRALVMELVPGETLAGPISVEDALPIVNQLIDALEYAHDKGMVHRDIKPANIKVTPEGVVKLLDFGLVFVGQTSRPVPAEATQTISMTQAGTIMGSAAYMSPEQARGQAVDRRADIWAFGVVVYEFVTGRQMFEGPTVSDTLAAVLRQDPDLDVVPTKLRRLVRACLVRDIRRRMRDIGDARLLLDEPVPEQTAAAIPARRPAIAPWLVAAMLFIGLAAVSWKHFRESTPAIRPVKFSVSPPEGSNFGSLAVSPDGRFLAFTAFGGPDARLQLWIRPLDAIEARPVAGSEGASYPFWSPDSGTIAFVGNGTKLKKVDITGGPPQDICNVTAPRGGSWNRDGIVIFAGVAGIFRVPASGGEPKLIAEVDRPGSELIRRWPVFLPDGKHFLFTVLATTPERTGIYVGSIDSKETVRILRDDTNTAYAEDPEGAGFILFSRNSALMAQRFDAGTRQIIGEPRIVAQQVGVTVGSILALHSVSETGVLAYLTSGVEQTQLGWFDRSGKRLGALGGSGMNGTPRISPDGKRVVAAQGNGGVGELYLIDTARDIATRFTFNQSQNLFPTWSPDGSFIVYASSRMGSYDLVRKPANGAGEEEVLLHSPVAKYPTDISPDGRFVLFSQADPKTQLDLWILPLDAGKERKPLPLLQTAAGEQSAVLSPDGKWFAYVSDESGYFEVYVRPFSISGSNATFSGGQWQVSKDRGMYPRWRRDGKELFYYSGAGKITAVDLKMEPAVQISLPKPLFGANLTNVSRFTVSDDGRRFLLPSASVDSARTPVTVVLNWAAGLK